MTTNVATNRINSQINDLELRLENIKDVFERGMESLKSDILKAEKTFEKYGISHLECIAFIDDYFNFKTVERSYEMSSAVKAKNLEKAIKELGTNFRTSVFDPKVYKGTSLGNSAPSIRIGYFLK